MIFEKIEPATDLSKSKISALLVEDDVDLFETWALILKGLEFDVELTWVTNARAAQTKLKEAQLHGGSFDLIISDIFISGGDTGIELWKRYRTNVRAFVFTSAISKSKFVNLFAWEEEIPEFIPKPADPAYAAEVIVEALKNSGRKKK